MTKGARASAQRSALVAEAAELARIARAGGSTAPVPSASGSDSVLASLAARANIDSIRPSGRARRLKQGVLRASLVFLRDQAAFNRLAVIALEDINARCDAVEARLAALEAHAEPGP